MNLPEKYRVTYGPLKTSPGDKVGTFRVHMPKTPSYFKLIVTVFTDEHLSVAINNRYPTWKELCFVKELFWGDSEDVIMSLPKKYCSRRVYDLHLKKFGI